MEDMFKKFANMAMECFDDNEKKVLGFDTKDVDRKQLDEAFVGNASMYSNTINGVSISKLSSKDSDSEVAFVFEDEQDATNMYDFFINNGLLIPGEVALRNIGEEHTVVFMPSVLVNKPELIQGALLAYEDRLDFSDEDSDYAFESFIDEMDNLLNEVTVSGASKMTMKGNPFHNKGDGKFTSPSDHMGSKGGSWSDGRRKLKFLGSGKDKKGGPMAKYGSTKHPCGRAAREIGKNVRCWDGSDLSAGQRVGKLLKGKKVRKEDLSIMDKAFLMEMRAKYRRLDSLFMDI
jgi:hypothetical protein